MKLLCLQQHLFQVFEQGVLRIKPHILISDKLWDSPLTFQLALVLFIACESKVKLNVRTGVAWGLIPCAFILK